MRVVSTNRVAGLVRSGNTRRLATLRVSTSWSRAQPGLGDRFLLKSFGDEGVAQMLHFLRSTRPGAFADDPAQIARTLAKLNSARIIQAVDQGRSVAEGAAAWLGVDLPATVWRRLSTSKGSL